MSPDKGRVERALEMLKSGLTGLRRWIVKKADLSVDTLIKWGIPAGCVSAVTNPDKVSALIEAVDNWLPFI